VAELVDAARLLLADQGSAALAVEVADGKVPLVADRAALARAVVEVLRNSVEAGSAGMRIVVCEADGVVVVDFIDDGAGIPEQLRDKVMLPFFSTRRNEGNAGLGLTLAEQLVRANGGTLSLGAGAKRGACVRLQLPRARELAQS
jgi:two-component system, OmpR family, sensor histidine kinase ChvG